MADFLFPFALGVASVLAHRFLFAQPSQEAAAVARARAADEAEFAQREALHAREGTSESAQWIDIVSQYAFHHFKSKVTDPVVDGMIKQRIQQHLAASDMGVFVWPVQLKSICVGDQLPVLTDVSVVSSTLDKPLVSCKARNTGRGYSLLGC